jgi:hypothetical protein
MITQERLQELLDYEPGTGNFRWRRNAGRYGRIAAGSIAGSVNDRGYVIIVIDGENYRAHRLAWLYMHGKFPSQLDHANRVKSDNRISNLRIVDNEENSANVGLRKDNTIGHRGVSFVPKLNKYQARYNKLSIGFFETAAEAGSAAFEFRKSKFREIAA